MALRKRLAQQGSSLMLTIVLGALSLTMAACGSDSGGHNCFGRRRAGGPERVVRSGLDRYR